MVCDSVRFARLTEHFRIKSLRNMIRHPGLSKFALGSGKPAQQFVAGVILFAALTSVLEAKVPRAAFGSTPNSSLSAEQKASAAENLIFGYPSHNGVILFRKGYVLSYNTETKVADWVEYHLTESYIASGVKRKDNFRADQDLPKGQRSELADYDGSGFDRGHLAPAEDMKRSAQIMSESFLLSNMSPQKPEFNRGIWKSLEVKVRKWTKEKKDIHVITGPLYLDGNHNTIGPDHVVVPSHFYKIIIAGSSTDPNIDAIAFVLPNCANESSLLPNFISDIDHIEKLTGLDFLSELKKPFQELIESKTSEMW